MFGRQTARDLSPGATSSSRRVRPARSAGACRPAPRHLPAE